MPYAAPVADLLRSLSANGDLERILALPGYADLGLGVDDIAPVLEEAGKFASQVLDPLNRVGDLEGSRVTPEGVVAAGDHGLPVVATRAGRAAKTATAQA